MTLVKNEMRNEKDYGRSSLKERLMLFNNDALPSNNYI
jgi:hypothetical protein